MLFCQVIKCALVYILYLDFCIFCACEVKEGEPCSYNSTIGKCKSLSNCQSALDSIDSGKSPQFCMAGSEANFNALVCCHDSVQESQESKERISSRMCKKYHPQLFLPEGEKLLKTNVVAAKDFPHMALIEYGDEGDSGIWCVGALISEKFVLTAAHCAYTRSGSPTLVRLGDLNISQNAEDADPQNFTVIRSIAHPEYKPDSHYHDIALLELDRPANFSDYVKPICLYQSSNISSVSFASATGWRNTASFGGTPSKHFHEASLILVNNSRCNDFYKSSSLSFQKMIRNDIQICAGGSDKRGTNCQGDSGGPLQIRKSEFVNSRKYDLIGITSFGMVCGSAPDVYTRVFFYLDWIEKNVWP